MEHEQENYGQPLRYGTLHFEAEEGTFKVEALFPAIVQLGDGLVQLKNSQAHS